jgi:hypothetical protein
MAISLPTTGGWHMQVAQQTTDKVCTFSKVASQKKLAVTELNAMLFS